jgi:hypothetical protein
MGLRPEVVPLMVQQPYHRGQRSKHGVAPMKLQIALALLLATMLACGPSQIDSFADLPDARRVLRVPEQYHTIQAAVAAAGVGDRVLVRPGTYHGTVVITGASKNNLQILADGKEGQVLLQGDHRQQTARTCKFSQEPLCPERAGFFLADVERVIIRTNVGDR